MKTLKRSLSVFLAMLLVMGSVSVMASAVVGDGNQNSWTIETRFFRWVDSNGDGAESDDEWIETSKVARGENIKARIFVNSDYAVGGAEWFWMFTKNFMTVNEAPHTVIKTFADGRNSLELLGNPDENSPTGSVTYAHGGIWQYSTDPHYSSATEATLEDMYYDGFLSDDDFVEHGYIYAQQEKGSAAVTYNDSYWIYEFNFTVNADATGTGNMFVQEGTVQDTGDHAYSKMYLSKQPAGDGGPMFKNVIAGYSLDFDWSDIGTGVTADNTVTFNAGEGKFADGTATATSTGYIKEAVASVPTPTASGKNFIGWVPSTVSNPTAADVVDASAIAYDYEAVTYNALYEASSGSYTLNVYTMGTDGQYGAPVTTNPGASVGEEVSYTTPAPEGFTIDNDLSELTGTVKSDGSTTLNVYLARNKVNVTINGVTGEYYYGAEIADPGDPTPEEGKRFTGWQDQNGNTVTFPLTVPASEIEVSAVYEDITYTLTYYLDDAKTIVYSTADYKFGDTIVAPADPTTADFGEGKTFTAWDYDVPATMPSHNIDVVAMLEDIAYTVEFIGLDGATAIPGSTLTKYYNDQVTLAEAPDATEEGYTFNGWKYADNSSVTFPITVTDNVKIYADYAIQSFKVSFYNDDEGTELFKEYDLEFESEIPDPGTPVKEGYTFIGWDPDLVGSAMPAEDTAAYAVWEANKYTIAFDTDGGSEVAPITQDYATEVTAPADPTKTGYTFAGWYNGETKVDFPVTMPVDGMALTAKWTANDYTITFNTDGGTEVAPITQDYATEVVAPTAPTKTGYTFAGWYNGDVEVTFPVAMPVDGMNLTAHWTVNEYKVTWDVDGVKSEETYAYGATIVAPEAPTKTGYTFAGWTPEVAATMPATDVTYTATWTANTYNAVFDANGGYFDGDTTVTTKTVPTDYDATIAVPAAPEKPGYTFNGWDPTPATMNDVNGLTFTAKWIADTDTTYTVETYTMGTDGQYVKTSENKTGVTDTVVNVKPATVAEGFALNDEKSVYEGTVAADNSLVLKVYIDRISYNFKTVVDGVETSTAYLYGATIVAPEEPAKTGYTFNGWSPAVPATMPAADVTVTAQWTINKYTITFDTDGGSAVAPITQDYATDITAPEAPTKTGYTFNGWTPALPDTMPAENVTVKAQWQINEYTVTWRVDGVDKVDTYNYGEAITKYEPSKTGYTFSGWNSEVPATMPAENIVISGTFTVNQYDALFYSEGVLVATVPTNYGEVPVAPEDPVKTGYNFVGWTPTLAAMGIDGARYDAVFSAGSVAYTVNVYTMDLTGNYGEPVAKTLYGDADTEATYTPDVLEGFTVADNSVLSGTVAADGSLVLSVYYSRNQYTFKTVVDGVETPVTYYYGAAVAAVEDPAKTGYTFDGWDKEIPATMPAADVTVTAQWTINQYTITFDTDGGSAVAPITQNYATDITAPEAPTKTGYTFAGWTPAVPDTMPAENVTVKAQWNINSYKLSFEVDGAVVRGPEDVEFDSAITAPSVDEKEGYTFVGWFAKETGEAMPAKMPAKDVVYEAVWTNGTNTRYTIEVYMMDTNGNYSLSAATVAYGMTGSVQTIVPGTIVGCTVDTALSELSKAISADGSMVLKVYYARNIYTVTYDSEAPVNVYYGAAIPAYEPAAQTGKTFTGWSPEVPATMPAENLVFTSTWEDTLYTITYVVNGTKSVAQYAYGAAVVAPEDPTVDGMTFTGWEPAVPDTMPAEDLIIVAKFENAVYKVTYLTDVGGEVFEEMLVRAGETVPVPTETPEKEYYVFLNWDNVPAVMPANNITIVPVFERVPVKLIPMAGSTTVIDRDNMVIYGLRERLTEELLLGTYLDVEGDGYITITPVADRCYGTGTIVDLYDNVTGEKLETYVIVVFGDLNGDSRVNSTDASMADDEAFRLTSWSSQTKYVDGALVENSDYNPYRTMAADLNKDGKVNATDASDISNTSIGISLIDQTTGTVHR